MDNETLEIAYEAESLLETEAIIAVLDEQGIQYTTRSQGLSTLFGGGADGSSAANESTQILVKQGDINRAQEAILNYHGPD
jgi:hypothetical protein